MVQKYEFFTKYPNYLGKNCIFAPSFDKLVKTNAIKIDNIYNI